MGGTEAVTTGGWNVPGSLLPYTQGSEYNPPQRCTISADGELLVAQF